MYFQEWRRVINIGMMPLKQGYLQLAADISFPQICRLASIMPQLISYNMEYHVIINVDLMLGSTQTFSFVDAERVTSVHVNTKSVLVTGKHLVFACTVTGQLNFGLLSKLQWLKGNLVLKVAVRLEQEVELLKCI